MGRARCTKSSVDYLTLPGETKNPALWDWIRRDICHTALILELSEMMRYEYGILQLTEQTVAWLGKQALMSTDEVWDALRELVEIGYLDDDALRQEVAWSETFAKRCGELVTDPDKRRVWRRTPTAEEYEYGKLDPPPKAWHNGKPIRERVEDLIQEEKAETTAETTAEETEAPQEEETKSEEAAEEVVEAAAELPEAEEKEETDAAAAELPEAAAEEEAASEEEYNEPEAAVNSTAVIYTKPALDDIDTTENTKEGPVVIYADTDGHALAVKDARQYDKALRIFAGDQDSLLDTAADIIDYNVSKSRDYLVTPTDDRWDAEYAIRALTRWHRQGTVMA